MVSSFIRYLLRKNFNLIVLFLTFRILSKHIIKKSCVWYNTIYNYLKSFKVLGIPWLPEHYILPENLTRWLDLPWINEDIEEYKSLRIIICICFVTKNT